MKLVTKLNLYCDLQKEAPEVFCSVFKKFASFTEKSLPQTSNFILKKISRQVSSCEFLRNFVEDL